MPSEGESLQNSLQCLAPYCERRAPSIGMGSAMSARPDGGNRASGGILRCMAKTHGARNALGDCSGSMVGYLHEGEMLVARRQKTELTNFCVGIDPETLRRLKQRARARVALCVRESVGPLIREALREWFRRHPDTEFFLDASPEDVARDMGPES